MDRAKKILSNHCLRLGLILTAGALLRLICLSWGLPDSTHEHPFHPDEEASLETVLFQPRPDEPFQTTQHGLVTGMGYFYAGKAALKIAEKAGLVRLDLSGRPSSLAMKRRVYILLRLLTAAFSIGTIFICYLAAKEWKGIVAGQLAALFIALEPVSVVNAHYIKSDSAAAFFVMLTLYFTLRSREKILHILPAAIAAGLAAGTKHTVAFAVIPVIAAPFLFHSASTSRKVKYIAMAIPLFIAAFCLLSPAALFYLDRMAYDLLRFPYLQPKELAIGPTLFHLLNYPVLFARANSALITILYIFALIVSIRPGQRDVWIFFFWLLPYGFLVISFSNFFLRYTVPMMPILSMMLAGVFFELKAMSRLSWKHLTALSIPVSLLLLFVSFVHLHTMAGKDPRIQARKWIEAHIPPGASIAVTLKYPNDHYFTVPIPSQFEIHTLIMRENFDVSSYMDEPFSYMAANEIAWTGISKSRHQSHELFWKDLNESGNWKILATFNNRPRIPGSIFLEDKLPPDMYYIYQETRVYHRIE